MLRKSLRKLAKVHRFFSLSPQLQWQLFLAVLSVPLTALAMRCWGFQRTQALLGFTIRKSRRHSLSADTTQQHLQITVRALQLLTRHGPYRGNCLSRSLVLWWLLGRQGIASDLRIGTRKEEGRFQAHAWIEREGLILNDAADVHDRFTAFDNLQIIPSRKAVVDR